MIANTIITNIKLLGQSLFWDTPPIPDKYSCEFDLLIYDKTEDSTSIGIKEYKMWEGWETVLALQILKRGSKGQSVIDFGSHIGWYSIMSAINGYRVYCYDESDERIQMLNESARLNHCNKNVFCIHTFVNENSKWFIGDITDVRLFKSDLEGNDIYAVKMYKHLFEEWKIDYAMIEISPCFNSSYPEMVEYIAGLGYDVYDIPDKTFKHRLEYGDDPLKVLKEQCFINGNYGSYISNFNQKNFLFIKK